MHLAVLLFPLSFGFYRLFAADKWLHSFHSAALLPAPLRRFSVNCGFHSSDCRCIRLQNLMIVAGLNVDDTRVGCVRQRANGGLLCVGQ